MISLRHRSFTVLLSCLVTLLMVQTMTAASETRIREPRHFVLELDDNRGIKCVPMKAEEAEARFGLQDRRARIPGPRSVVRYATQYSEFEVSYVGFSNEAKAAFEKAVEIWAQNISSPITIRIEAVWTSEGFNENTLGHAGANSLFLLPHPNPAFGNAWFPDALADKISGFDRDRNGPDIVAEFNSAFSDWYFGLDQLPPFEKYDFVSVVLHEITHGLGFSTSMKIENGIGSWGGLISGPGSSTPKAFDLYLSDSDFNEYLMEKYPNNSPQLGDVLQGNDIFNQFSIIV